MKKKPRVQKSNVQKDKSKGVNSHNNASKSEIKSIETKNGNLQINYSYNTEINLITIHEEKLRIYISEYKDSVDNQSEWKTALALFITILIGVLCSTFNDFLGISASVWKAIFIIMTVMAFIWLVIQICRCCKKEITIEQLIAKIKNEQLRQ